MTAEPGEDVWGCDDKLSQQFCFNLELTLYKYSVRTSLKYVFFFYNTKSQCIYFEFT